MWPERSRTVLFVATLGVATLSCNAALIGGGVAALGTGAGIVASRCYDQLSIRVHDDEGRRTCDAQVSVLSDGSEQRLRPCYHASLTEGRYRVSVQRAGYQPADVELTIPEHEGSCPHYTHTIEFTLRRTGAPPPPSGFAHPKPATSEPTAPRARERPTLPAPIPTPPNASPPNASPPSAPTPSAPAGPAAAPPGAPSAPAGSAPAPPGASVAPAPALPANPPANLPIAAPPSASFPSAPPPAPTP